MVERQMEILLQAAMLRSTLQRERELEDLVRGILAFDPLVQRQRSCSTKPMPKGLTSLITA